jgi:transcriptional regulator with XRE-family HTH domain
MADAPEDNASTPGLDLGQLAHRVRSLRQASGLTLDKVAAAADQTRSWLSKVENGHITPSLPALGRIAAVLGVSLSHLLTGLDVPPPVTLTRLEHRPRETDWPAAAGSTVHKLAARLRPAHLESWSIRLDAGSEQLMPPRSGEGQAIVVAGMVDARLSGQRLTLSTGDSLAFDARQPVNWTNAGSQPVEIVVWIALADGLGRWPTEGSL